MFKNRELKVQFVKTPKQNANTEKEQRPNMTPGQITRLVQQNVQSAAFILGVCYAGKKALDTASEIALLAARANFK